MTTLLAMAPIWWYLAGCATVVVLFVVLLYVLGRAEQRREREHRP